MTANSIIKKQRAAELLLIEDNTGDAILTKRAFGTMSVPCNITVAKTGEEAISMLKREGKHADYTLPDLILLDLNLPQMGGQDVLKVIKTTPGIMHIPVIVLSSSRAERDVIGCYNLHANGYILKPVSIENFEEVAQKLEAFWFTLAITADPADIDQAGAA